MSVTAEVPLSEAAQRLGLTWGQAYNRLLAGELKGRKAGARWLVDEASVQAAALARQSAPSGGR